MASRGQLASAIGVLASVAGGVATNRVEGALWAQAVWFAAAATFAGSAAWLMRRPVPLAGDDEEDPQPGNPRPGDGPSGRSLRLTDTGSATGREANTGVTAPADAMPDDVIVERTGDANATDDGIANAGVRITGRDPHEPR
ncbi:hypothetical protein [Streptomyces sp. SD31]|uniref:hypothetical protein n=1 Tax=Streptomyces sp. SD31 TaxID=3452208 RepID=UPI003F8B1319